MIDTRRSRRHLSERVARAVSLVDLRMRRIDADLLSPVWKRPLTPTAAIDQSMSRMDDLVVYDYVYKIDAFDSNQEHILRASVTLNLVFKVIENKDVPEDELRAFGDIGVVEIAHPYVREMLHNLSGRMGMPPLVIEVAPPVNEVSAAAV